MESVEFLDAAKSGDLEKVKALVKKGEDINQVQKSGTSAIMYAVQYVHKDVAAYLIEQGANLDLETSMGGTALSRAAENNDVELMQLLLSNGASITTLPIIVAARKGNLDAVKVLVEHGADVDAQQSWGHTALMLASKEGHADVVRFLLDQGANYKLKDKNGNNALSLASQNDQLDIASLLKRAGAQASVVAKKPKKVVEETEDTNDEDDMIDDTLDVDELKSEDAEAPDDVELD